jgi:hypothetical protein
MKESLGKVIQSMTNPIRDELHRLAEEFGKLLDGTHIAEKTTLEELIQRFGLTLNEAEEWLKSEPSFSPSDGFLQHKKSDKDFTAPYFDRFLFLACCLR